MVTVGTHSDRSGERYRHIAAMAFMAATGLALSALSGKESMAIFLITISMSLLGLLSVHGPFWSMSTQRLRKEAAGDIALVNSIGNLGGFVGPFLTGYMKSHAGTFTPGLLTLALFPFFAGLLALVLRKIASHNYKG